MPPDQPSKPGNDPANADTNKPATDDKDKKSTDTGDLVTIKISGVDKAVTRDELIKLAEKSAGADEAFRKAAEHRKLGDRGVKISTLIDQISGAEDGPSTEDLSELAGLLGVDSSELIDALAATGIVESDDDDEEPAKSKGKGKPAGPAEAKKAKKVALDDLDPAVAEIVKDAQKQQFAKIVEGIRKECGEAVDKDGILSKIISGAGADKKADLQQALVDMVYMDIQRRVQAGGQYGPDMVSDAVLNTRTSINKLGVSATPSKYTSNAMSVLLGLGPESGGIPAEALSDEPVKRVASTDPNYEKNVVARVIQQIHKASASAK